MVNAANQAEKLGSLKVMNVILLGAIIKAIGLEDVNLEKIIRDNAKPQFIELNLKEIETGMNLV